jgi:hypothetical protein
VPREAGLMPDEINREDIVTAMAEGETAAALFSFAAALDRMAD